MPESHRLAAVVMGDVVGYSALMERDDQATLAHMRLLSSDIVAPITQRFNGRVVKGAGDGWLAEFGSVTDALLSSLEIQAELTSRQHGIPKARRMALRIGVSLGEVTVENGDVFGTGVILAAASSRSPCRVGCASPTGRTSRCGRSPGSTSRTWGRGSSRT